MDTAKAANLYSTYPNDFMAYVLHQLVKELGSGTSKTSYAIPTTTGTGSETTGGAIFDQKK